MSRLLWKVRFWFGCGSIVLVAVCVYEILLQVAMHLLLNFYIY